MRLPIVPILAALCTPLAAFGQYDPNRVEPSPPNPLQKVEQDLKQLEAKARALEAPPAFFYFPATPPVLDRPRIVLETMAPDRRSASPALAPYVDDIFYGSIGPRLTAMEGASGNTARPLSRRHLSRLESYRIERDAAYQELRLEIERVWRLEASARRAALAAFARQQTPRLVALEQTAEKIRRELKTADWSETRRWRLGERDAARGDSPREIAAVMRAYSYFENHLSTAQRRLLREMSIEFALANDSVEAAANEPFWYFSPEPARIVLPTTLPPAIAARFGDYQTKKSQLKQELYDAVYTEERAALRFLGGTDFQALAARQAPQFVALEAMAEEIRVELSRLPSRGRQLETSALQPELTRRIFAWIRQQQKTRQTVVAELQAVHNSIDDPSLVATYRVNPAGVTYEVRLAPSGGRQESKPSRLQEEQIAALEARFAAVAEEHAQTFRQQDTEFAAIREAARAAMPQASLADVDLTIGTPMRMALQELNQDAFHEYFIATLEPGLSIEQRRLLFAKAIEHLDVPLPRGEPRPTLREDW